MFSYKKEPVTPHPDAIGASPTHSSVQRQSFVVSIYAFCTIPQIKSRVCQLPTCQALLVQRAPTLVVNATWKSDTVWGRSVPLVGNHPGY